jgi:ribosomal protein S12 methylthiotransferase
MRGERQHATDTPGDLAYRGLNDRLVAVTKKSPTKKDAPVVALVNLGCAKNTVDSERILGGLAEQGFLLAADPADADVCLVNTCGFIHDARKESAAVLREIRRLKNGGRLRAVVALGCLVERAAGMGELQSFLKGADVCVGFSDYPRIAEICRALADGKNGSTGGQPVAIGDRRFAGRAAAARPFAESYSQFLTAPRLRIGSPHIAHLKISEGCSNFCRFCSIPYIRGVQSSRPMEAIVEEARQLLDAGARELSLIAQDTTSYGRDLYGEYRLAALLRALTALPDDFWLRVMYVFPRFLTGETIDLLGAGGKICPYVDIPLQHISDRMLSLMGRGMDKRETVALLDRLAARLPDGAIRTTFIVGHPGEKDGDFEELLAFVREGRFTHAGVFVYSREPGTPSARAADDVPLAEKIRRRDAVMRAQREVSRARMEKCLGQEIEALVDRQAEEGVAVPPGTKAVARSRLQASEVDGAVFLCGKNAAALAPGDRVAARVTEAMDYDLVAEPVAG